MSLLKNWNIRKGFTALTHLTAQWEFNWFKIWKLLAHFLGRLLVLCQLYCSFETGRNCLFLHNISVEFWFSFLENVTKIQNFGTSQKSKFLLKNVLWNVWVHGRVCTPVCLLTILSRYRDSVCSFLVIIGRWNMM